MSASTGPTSKGEKGKPKYQCLDINSIYNSTRSETSEAQTTKSTVPRKHGMQQLGKVPQRRPPANLPSLKSENSGNDPSISLVPSGVQGWGLKPGESQQLSTGVGSLQSNQTNQSSGQTAQQNQNLSNQSSPAPAAGVITAASLPPSQTQHQQTSQAQAQQSQDKTWSSVTGGGGAGQGGPGSGPADGGPSFLAHQSPLFRQEFPCLSGEPGAAPGLPTTPAYGPGPSLRPQTEPTSWTHNKPSPQQQHPAQQPSIIPTQFKSVVPSFMMSQGSGFPMFPESIQKKSRSQASAGGHPEGNRMNRMMGGVGGGGRSGGGANSGPPAEGEDLVLSRPIIREEELVKMDELARDPSWAASDDIDYNEQLSFSDGESIEDDKEKDFKFKDKCKQQPMRDDKKDDMDKMNRDKGLMLDRERDRDRDRDRGQQPWRVTIPGGGVGIGSNASPNYTDFRNPMPRQQMQGGNRIDDDEMWKEKRRQMHEHKQVVAEKAKQRKEEEEKRYEETARAKRNNRDELGGDWEDRAKISGDNFRQMTQFPLESRSGMNREKDRDREMRRDRDRDGQFGGSQRFNQSRPPRFRKDGGGGKQGSQSSWPGHNPGSFLSRRNNDQIMDDQHDRFRGRDDRDRGSEGKRNYYDSQSMDHSQQYHERDYDRDYRSNAQSHHQQSDKEMGGRDIDKELRDSPKSESDHRGFDDVRNRRESKQQNDHYEEKENEWRDKRGDYGSRGEASSERPSRPESRDSKASRDSDHRPLVDPSDSFHDSYLADKIDKLTLSKDIRREPQVKGREHVPGPITQEKLTAYEHKHSQSQLEKGDGQEKDSEDKRIKRGDGEISTSSSQAWGEDKSLDMTSQSHLPATSPTSCLGGIVASDMGRQSSDPLTGDEGKPDTDLDKRKENGGGERLRERRDDPSGGLKTQQLGQGQHLGRNNRGSRGGGPRNNSYPSKYNSYQQQGPTWQHPKDSRSRQQQGSRGRGKNWNHSESDGSGDEVSTESGKDDKKNDKKLDGGSKMGTWKSDNKDRRDDKKDSKKEQSLGGTDSDKEKIKDKKGDNRGGMSDSMSRKSADGGGFGPKPTGEVSRRGRGGMRGQSRLGMGPPALYGPPGSKPFSSAGAMGPHQTNSSSQLDSSHQPSSPPHHMGRKDDGGKGDKLQHRGKNTRTQDENWETTSETSDGSEAKKPNKNRNSRLDRKRGGGGTIGEKRNLINSQQHHVNGKPDSEDRKSNKDDSDTSLQPYSNNGFQEVKSKKGGGKDGRGGTKEDGKQRSRSKNKDKMGGVKGQQKSFSREFVGNKPPRLLKLETSRKQQMVHGGSNSPDVSDMNKINQNVSSLFPNPRNSNVSTEVSCPPAHNAWNKPISSLRSTPPLGPAPPLTQLTVASAQIAQDKTTSLEEIGQVGGSAPSASPNADKAIAKLNREVVDKSLLEGPPVNTIIFENTNYKREPPGDIGSLKQCFPMKHPSRTSMDKPRDRKLDEELPDGAHSLSLGGFKAATAASASDLQSPDSKQDAIQVSMPFGKNEDTADMKLDFFDSDLSQLSDDKTNQSMHVGQSGAADLNQKIASVKKVWDNSPPSMSGHVVEESGGVGGGGGNAFSQGFPPDKGLDPSSAAHHPDHNDFNTSDSVYGSGQLSSGGGGGGVGGGGGYASAGSMMKGDAIVSNTSTMCKAANMFQVSAQPQQISVMTHPGPLSTPPPIPSVLSYQPGFSSNLSAVPSPPNVMFNSQQGSGAPPQELYPNYSLSSAAAQMGGAGTRSYTEYPPPSYNMSQSSTYQPSIYMPSAPSPSVFQNPNQYRMAPHGSAALSQQMSSNPSTMLMTSSTSSVVSGTQVKSNQGSLQPTAIGSKSGGGPPTGAPTFPPPATPILLIESTSGVGFLHHGYQRPATIQPSSSFFAANSGLGPAGSTGGLFNSASLLSGGGGGAGTGSLPPSGNPFGVQPAAPSQYSQQQQPTSSHQQPYPTQPQQQPVAAQMSGSGGGGFRSQTGGGYPKAGGPHPSDSAKSSQSDQFSIFQPSVQGKGSRGMNLGKGQPQPSGSPQPQQNKFSYNSAASHSVATMQGTPYQQPPPNSAPPSRQPPQQVMRSGVSVGVVQSQTPRYITPIQRPHPPSPYSQQQAAAHATAAMLQQQQQAVARQQQQQRSLQQQVSRGAPQQQQGGGPSQQQPPPQQQPTSQPIKPYYQQQGGGMKLEPEGVKSNESEEGGKSVQDKASKQQDDLSSQQQDQ